MANISFIIGIIGNAISILMFASPINTFKQVVKKKSTENYKELPYITTLLSTSLWTFYGLLKPGGLLIVTVNGAGATMHVVYVSLFLFYASKKIKVSTAKMVGIVDIGLFGGVVIVTMLGFNGPIRLTIVGLICAAITIGMYAAPLSVMKTVIKMKSVKYMPFFLSFFQFLNGGVWSIYAVLIRDYYIGVPNGIGFLLGSAQLVLYVIYNKKSSNERAQEEQGSAHLYDGAIQMQDHDQNEEKKMKNRSLSKGNSLPKPSISRKYSDTITKARSLNPYELEKFDIENDRS